MSVRQVTCFIAACDDCEEDYEHDYTPHWPGGGEAIDDAVNSADWWGRDDRLLCDECRIRPHALIESEMYADACDRCGNPPDEHPQDGAS